MLVDVLGMKKSESENRLSEVFSVNIFKKKF